MVMRKLEILKGLKAKANYSYDLNYSDYYNFPLAMPEQTRGPSISSLSQGYSNTSSFLEEYFLTYNKTFNKHAEITHYGGYSAQLIKGNFVNASRSGYTDTDPKSRVLNFGSSANNNGNNNANQGLQSYFVSGNYAYDNRYLLTVTMRADGSSKFAPNDRWGYFPAFSAGWRISQEKFYSDAMKDIFSSLKLTGGWGQLGNQNIGDFNYLSSLSYGSNYGYALGTTTAVQNGAVITGLANPNVHWESTKETNISLEFTALQDHLNGSITYFNRNTSQMLIPYQLVETFGAQTNLPDDPGNISLPDQNIGEMNNHGVEVELDYHNKAGNSNILLGRTHPF